jgi:RNA polymerase sigma factor (sigma-70 family)
LKRGNRKNPSRGYWFVQRARQKKLNSRWFAGMTMAFDERALWLGRYILPHEPALRAWLWRRSLGGLEVDDVIQESYTRLIVAQAVDHIRDHKTYLFQIAKSVIASHVRSAKVVQIVTVSDLDLLGVAAAEPSAEDQVSDREQLRDLAKAIAALPEPTRTIFRLRRVEQIPQRDISRRLAIPESTVEKHISRALLFMSDRYRRGGDRVADASKASVRTRVVANGQKDRLRD